MTANLWFSSLRTAACGGIVCALCACSQGSDNSAATSDALSKKHAGAAQAAPAAQPTAQPPACDKNGAIEVETHSSKLWPPNHKFHDVAASDCVSASDACGNELLGDFAWGSSDEPVDANGDGHFGPDIGLGADVHHACVRSERQGPKDGRVYKLGVHFVDANGNQADGECVVIVDHDQRGVTGSDSGEAYRLTFDASQAGTNCDGTPAMPPGEGSGGQGGAGGAGGAGGEEGGGGQGGAGGQEGSGGTSGSAGEGAGSGGNGGQPIDDAGAPF
jgi:hypothetical protein